MPRGTSRYDEARIQRRNWEPFGVSNLCLRSEEIGDANYWISNFSGFVLTDVATVVSTNNQDPANTFNAARITFATSGNPTLRRAVFFNGNGNVALVNGTVYTASVWVKQAPSSSATNFRITTNNTFAWNTGGSTRVALTNQWQRVMVTWTQSNTNAYLIFGGIDATGTKDTTCAGDALLWGATLAAGSFPQGYARTVTTQYSGPRGPIDQNKEAAYLYWKYGIPTDPLPNTNPYKFRPPLIGD